MASYMWPDGLGATICDHMDLGWLYLTIHDQMDLVLTIADHVTRWTWGDHMWLHGRGMTICDQMDLGWIYMIICDQGWHYLTHIWWDGLWVTIPHNMSSDWLGLTIPDHVTRWTTYSYNAYLCQNPIMTIPYQLGYLETNVIFQILKYNYNSST